MAQVRRRLHGVQTRWRDARVATLADLQSSPPKRKAPGKTTDCRQERRQRGLAALSIRSDLSHDSTEVRSRHSLSSA